MSSRRLRLRRTSFSLNLLKHDVYKSPPGSPGVHLASSASTTLTPDLQLSGSKSLLANDEQYFRVGSYLLYGEAAAVSHSVVLKSYEAVSIVTSQNFTCKVLPVEQYKGYLTPYYRVGSHDHIAELHEVIVGEKCVYAFFARHYGDLHSYVRSSRRLKDTDASHLFSQIVSVVAHCHESGVVLRDLKLRKFVFKDEARTQLMLENLDDACVLNDDDNDQLCDRHGCPAYVSPEILAAADSTYSGRSADVWSLGVVLYTMLVGRYPFHDADPISLFRLIRQCRYTIPRRAMSEQAECLVRWILHSNPCERPTADEILSHPWFDLCRRYPSRADRYFTEKSDIAHVTNASKERDAEVPVGLDPTSDQTVPVGTYNGSITDFDYD